MNSMVSSAKNVIIMYNTIIGCQEVDAAVTYTLHNLQHRGRNHPVYWPFFEYTPLHANNALDISGIYGFSYERILIDRIVV